MSGLSEVPRRAERTVRAIDSWQQRHAPLAFSFAVVKKFGDDRGGSLAGLIAFYGFLSIFPLLLIAVTVLGYALGNDPSLQQRLLSNSIVGHLPVISQQLETQVQHPLRGQGLGLAIGLVGLLWGTLGVANAAQFAMQQVWAVPGVRRPGFFPRTARSALFLGVLGLGAVGSSALTGFGAVGRHIPLWSIAVLVGSAVVNITMFWVGFRVLTPSVSSWRVLLRGAVLAGAGWTLLQTLAGYLLGHELAHASEAYGTFGLVLALIWFLSLGAQLSVYAAEVNVVWARHLWPRSIVQPPLTTADKAVLVGQAGQEERRPEERIDVTFEPSAGV